MELKPWKQSNLSVFMLDISFEILYNIVYKIAFKREIT